jgi:hypothetical protein
VRASHNFRIIKGGDAIFNVRLMPRNIQQRHGILRLRRASNTMGPSTSSAHLSCRLCCCSIAVAS